MERVRSSIRWLTPDDVVEALDGLPRAHGYELHVKPLRYRDRPHLAALTEFDARRITVQVPEPFFPFGEIVPYAAKRIAAKGIRFAWISEGITFRRPDEVLRFLWCHEWYHWYLKEVLGRKSHAETACDRFALRNYLKDHVTLDDAAEALKRPKIEEWSPKMGAQSPTSAGNATARDRAHSTDHSTHDRADHRVQLRDNHHAAHDPAAPPHAVASHPEPGAGARDPAKPPRRAAKRPAPHVPGVTPLQLDI